MAGFIALNPQEVVSFEQPGSNTNPVCIGIVGPVMTDLDTHAVYIVSTVNLGGPDLDGTIVLGCYRCATINEDNDVLLGAQVGTGFAVGRVQDGPPTTVTVRFVDPDPPAGGFYAVTTSSPGNDGSGDIEALSVVAYAF